MLYLLTTLKAVPESNLQVFQIICILLICIYFYDEKLEL